jgi:hypothetical protein
MRKQVLIPNFLVSVLALHCNPAAAECCINEAILMGDVRYVCTEDSMQEVHIYEGLLSQISESLNSALTCKHENLSQLLKLDLESAKAERDIPHKVTISIQDGKYSLEANQIPPDSQNMSGTFEMLRNRANRSGQNPKLSESMNEVLDAISQQLNGHTTDLWITLTISTEGDAFKITANAKSKR